MEMRKMKIFAGILTVGATAMFVATAVNALWYAPDTEIPAPALEAALAENVPPEEYPVRMRIPALNIDAAVQHVGINAKGNMANPNNFTDVGWYKYGTPPGYVGSAVVAGHVDNGLSLPGVFKNLGELKIGDNIYVVKKDGSELNFRVTEIQTYPYTRVPLSILFSRKDVARLNLVTCDGAWVAGEKTYDERLIVYAELVQ